MIVQLLIKSKNKLETFHSSEPNIQRTNLEENLDFFRIINSDQVDFRTNSIWTLESNQNF